MKLWVDGDLDRLLQEGRTIQQRMRRTLQTPRSEEKLAHSFAKLMMEGKVRAALRLISKHEGGPPLALDEKVETNGKIQTVRDVLKLKHPKGAPISPSAIVSVPSPVEPHPVIFDHITGPLVRSIALRTEGAAGPSGIDAQGWRCLCSSFQQASSELCEALACLINTYRHNPKLFVGGETLLSQEGTTQGDPLAMAMYAIAIAIGTLPLIHRLDQITKQVWYAGDATAGGRLHHLHVHSWWTQLLSCGPEYGYHANASKTWLVVKQEYLSLATEPFADSGIQVTVEGRRHLGAALGTRSFTEAYVNDKVLEWVGEVARLSSITSSQPHTAYAALTHGLISKWTYLMRTVQGIGDLFEPLEKAIQQDLLPALTGRTGLSATHVTFSQSDS